MEKYKAKVQKRIMVMAFILMIIAVIYFLFPIFITELPEIPDFIKGFHFGSFIGIELALVFFIAKFSASLRKEETLKKLYIEENDERMKLIMEKSGAVGMWICIVGLAVATIIAGFLDQTVFFSLLGALIFTSLVRGSIKIYYHMTM